MQESGITGPLNLALTPQSSGQPLGSSPVGSSEDHPQEGREAADFDRTVLTGRDTDGSAVPGDSSARIRKKRKKKGKGRRSTRRRDPRRAAIRLWAAILGVGTLIFGGGTYVFQYVTEAGEKRDRAVREMAGYVKKVERLEATSQTAQMADAKIVDLHPEAQQGRLLPPQIGRAGSVVLLRLHTPDGPLENWDLTLRDEMRNVVTKAVVSPSDGGVILISATGLREGIYEISGKARSKRQVSRYSFALK
jgi:hypothetical protein